MDTPREPHYTAIRTAEGKVILHITELTRDGEAALVKACEHWARLASELLDDGPYSRSCALCRVYRGPGVCNREVPAPASAVGKFPESPWPPITLEHCPVMARTWYKRCENTPYAEADELYDWDTDLAQSPKFWAAATRQLEFLQSLLPERLRKPRLDYFPMYTLQQFYDHVMSTVYAQGRRSTKIDLHGDNQFMVCRYRASDGRRCAAGQVIPDEIYDPRMETGNLAVMPKRIDTSGWYMDLWAYSRRVVAPTMDDPEMATRMMQGWEVFHLIEEMQSMHDRAPDGLEFKPYWVEKGAALAESVSARVRTVRSERGMLAGPALVPWTPPAQEEQA